MANGGIIGVVNTPTLSSASGVWSLQEQESARKAGIWPNNDPALELDFDETTTLDSRITFTRATNGTFFNSSGVLSTASSGAARFDHRLEGGVWVNKGLLIEEQRANVCLRSEDFSTTWTNGNSTETTNATTAPDGNTTADEITDNATDAGHSVQQIITTTPVATMSFSVFLKNNDVGWARLVLYSSATPSNAVRAWFDLANGAVGTVENQGTGANASASIENVGNGWYRCVISGRPATTGTNTGVNIHLQTADAQTTYIGTGQSLYAWGAQVEVGAFPTSYIKTTTASVTRNADQAVMTGTDFSDWYNATEGTVFFQMDRLAPVLSGFPTVCSFNDNTANERILININSDPDYRFLVVDGNVLQCVLEQPTSVSAGTVGKLCGAYKVNNFAFSADGNTVLTDTSGTVPSPNKVDIGFDRNIGEINGHIAKFYYWNTRKSNNFLQAITS